MPPVFKPLASIAAWILFIWSCVALVYFFVTVGMGKPEIAVSHNSIACLILSVCAIKLRQMLE